MTSDNDTLLGTIIGGRWRLTRKLGEGGMGAVYAAEGTNGEGEFAVKLLHREFVKEEQVVTRFYAEAEASKRLDHPNIARVFESGKADTGEPYLLMELLRGQPLADANPEGSRMDPARAVEIMQQVLAALTAAHAQDIVHRDLKPDNVFLVEADGGQRAKLLDFGIARVIDAAGGGMRKTKTGMLLGTPGYMSPEQLRNSKSVDPRSDLWSLCIVFYELLSGRDPYGATNDFARLTAVFTQDAIPIDRDAPELAPWRAFFERAFVRDINHRYQTAQEMGENISAVVQGRPLPPPQAPLASAAAGPPTNQVVVPGPVSRGGTASNQSMALDSTEPGGFSTAHLPPIVTGSIATAPTGAMPVTPQRMSVPSMPSTPSMPTPTPPRPALPTSTNRAVWVLVAIVLVLGIVIAGLAVQSMREPAGPAKHTAPTEQGKKKH